MRTLFLLGPLLLSILLVQLGVSALAPLDALSADYKGFTKLEIGLLGSAHFAGFMIGCVFGPALIARAGHSRAFAASAALGVLATLAHPLYIDPLIWMISRAGAGFAIAIGYTVVESWFHATTSNAARGRLLGLYKFVDLGGAVGSQLLLLALPLDVTLAYSYIIVAMLAAASLLPLSLTTAPPPPAPQRPKIRLVKAVLVSPLAAVGALVVGLGMSSFRMIGPIYASEFALSRAEVAYFLAAAFVGGAITSPILGMVSDKMDRRALLIGVSTATVLVCGALASGATPADPASLAIAAAVFGAAAIPLYSLSAAHANDFCPRDFVVELNAALLLIFAIGAVASPTLAAWLIGQFGPDALWAYIGGAHMILVVVGVVRAYQRPSAPRDKRKPYRSMPRRSILLGRLLKSSPSEAEGKPDLPTAEKQA